MPAEPVLDDAAIKAAATEMLPLWADDVCVGWVPGAGSFGVYVDGEVLWSGYPSTGAAAVGARQMFAKRVVAAYLTALDHDKLTQRVMDALRDYYATARDGVTAGGEARAVLVALGLIPTTEGGEDR